MRRRREGRPHEGRACGVLVRHVTGVAHAEVKSTRPIA